MEQRIVEMLTLLAVLGNNLTEQQGITGSTSVDEQSTVHFVQQAMIPAAPLSHRQNHNWLHALPTIHLANSINITTYPLYITYQQITRISPTAHASQIQPWIITKITYNK